MVRSRRHVQLTRIETMQRTYVKRRLRPRYFRISIVLAAFLLVVSVSWSYGTALTAPGGGNFGIRTVEWIRGHGGASFVAWAENTWYGLNKPPVGGKPPKGAIAVVSNKRGTTTTAVAGPPHLAPPRNLKPLVTPALPGEGVWQPQGRLIGGLAGLYTTSIRPSATYSSLVTGVAWMDPKLVSFTLFAGGQDPGHGPWQNMAPFTTSQEASLVAAFNSGFRMQDARGGWYSEGRMAYPLVNGAASFVIYKNGTANVVNWTDGQNVPSNVASVRQNLSLIVEGGKVNPAVYTGNFSDWGATVNNAVMVWRSAVGITKDGAIIYASGDGLSVGELAQVMVRAGAVRAMEMDINSYWTDFFYFNPPNNGLASPSNATKLVYNMVRPPQRYFEGTARDFIGVFARSLGSNTSANSGATPAAG